MHHALRAFWLNIRNWLVEPKYSTTCDFNELQDAPFYWWQSREAAIQLSRSLQEKYPGCGPGQLIRKGP